MARVLMVECAVVKVWGSTRADRAPGGGAATLRPKTPKRRPRTFKPSRCHGVRHPTYISCLQILRDSCARRVHGRNVTSILVADSNVHTNVKWCLEIETHHLRQGSVCVGTYNTYHTLCTNGISTELYILTPFTTRSRDIISPSPRRTCGHRFLARSGSASLPQRSCTTTTATFPAPNLGAAVDFLTSPATSRSSTGPRHTWCLPRAASSVL